MLTMLRLGEKGAPIRVVDDQRGAPTTAAQIARAVVQLLGGVAIDDQTIAHVKASPGIYHATASGETTWRGFAEAIFDERARRSKDFVAPQVIPITTAEYPTPAKRPAYSMLSNARLQGTFGIHLGDWREGLVEAISTLAGH
jgi:dTDP-4-dehydrorhamnose reductase